MSNPYIFILAIVQLIIILVLCFKNIKTTKELVALKNKEYELEKTVKIIELSHKMASYNGDVEGSLKTIKELLEKKELF